MQNERALVSKAEEISAAVKSGLASPALRAFVENRSPESLGIWFYQRRVFFVMLDNFHYQYRSGFMAEESWDAFRRQLRAELEDAVTAAYYRDYGTNSRESFAELCEQVLKEIESTSHR